MSLIEILLIKPCTQIKYVVVGTCIVPTNSLQFLIVFRNTIINNTKEGLSHKNILKAKVFFLFIKQQILLGHNRLLIDFVKN